MVSLSQVIASNQRIATLPPGLVAVFVGGTSGVGEYTVKAFARYAVSPRVYIVGRSQEAADRIIAECQQTNPAGCFTFLPGDVSLLATVDEVCREIREKESAINLLVETQGTMAYSRITAEGLPLAFATATHSRLRFILNLLPLLQKARSLRRVVSVLAASCEGPIDMTNMPALGFALYKSRDQMASIQTLLLEEACRRAPDVSFVHTVPGVVRGGITRDAESNGLLIAVFNLLMPFVATPAAECGERHVFLATSAVYPPSQGAGKGAGVVYPENSSPCRGSDGKAGSGMYTVDNKGEASPAKVERLLAGFRADGTATKVWEYIEADMKRITGQHCQQ
ncbi:hypothetical protein ASPZODRAFT_170125 [Penicilliopsis zonata CBS 506.65]|uniref:Ketoreductase (KR) domain-containing protein n=1 Tax=Penicilliopsis zonata CBS 506.65 TaxID=1073090 RepID=A0A1L9S5M4_9EURO|nr:hypothetical protein ASPZODRAFT_170125 [Penicilliopsis zonata CBS 506.65]OJJ42452.1 hypothetical protein ASPZODRAFT_170125 [Penicilliopsis zonata CBS 506.65]